MSENTAFVNTLIRSKRFPHVRVLFTDKMVYMYDIPDSEKESMRQRRNGLTPQEYMDANPAYEWEIIPETVSNAPKANAPLIDTQFMPFPIGSLVRHPKYGMGTVMRYTVRPLRVHVKWDGTGLTTPINPERVVPTEIELDESANVSRETGTEVQLWDEEANALQCDHGYYLNADVMHNGEFMFSIAINNSAGHTCPTREWMDSLNAILAMDTATQHDNGIYL